MINWKFFFGFEETKWRTHNGRIISINELHTPHINNIIDCFEGNGKQRMPDPYFGKTKDEWLSILHHELSNRLTEYYE